MRGLAAWTLLTLAGLGHAIYVVATLEKYADHDAAICANGAGLAIALYAVATGLFGLVHLRRTVGSRLAARLATFRFWRRLAYLLAACLLVALAIGPIWGVAKEVFRAALVGAVLIVLWTTARPPGRPRPWLERLDLVGANVLVTLVLLEGGLRLVAATSDSPLFMRFEADNKLERTLQPSKVRMGFRNNDRGFYDEPFATDKPAGTFRIVALGDSFAAGIVPYARNSLTLLERDLAAGGQAIEVYNMGVNGIDVGDYRYLYLTEGHTYRPDAVLVLFYLGNDFGSTALPGPLDRNFWYLWFVPSRLVAIGREAGRRGVDLSDVGAEKEGDDYVEEPHHEDPSREVPSYSEEGYLAIERNQLKYFQRGGSRKRRESRTLAALGDIFRAAAAGGARPALVVVPTEFAVDDEHYATLLAHHGLAEGDFDRSEPGQRLADWCAERRIPCLDLTAVLRAAHAEGTRLYHRRDMHWNAAGNRVAAAAMADFVRSELLTAPDRENP